MDLNGALAKIEIAGRSLSGQICQKSGQLIEYPTLGLGTGRQIMNRFITRRNFIKGGAVLGASTIMGAGSTGLMEKLALAAGMPDIASVKGADYFQNAIKAVELLGGMGKFVPKQSKVGLLINSPWDHPGSFVKPEITLAVIHMCFAAGAKEIGVFKSLSGSYWRRSPLAQKYRDEIDSLQSVGGWFLGGYADVAIPQGRSLKKAEVAEGLLEC